MLLVGTWVGCSVGPALGGSSLCFVFFSLVRAQSPGPTTPRPRPGFPVCLVLFSLWFWEAQPLAYHLFANRGRGAGGGR